MRVLIVLGSRNPNGQTAKAAAAFAEGVASAEGQCELLFLPSMRLRQCRQCEDSGWGICMKEGRCAIEDDFAGIVEKIRAADAVVFANPVYFGDLSESLRAFLDRLRRTCMNAEGKKVAAGRSAVGICVAGGGGGGAPSCVASLEKVLAHCGFNIIDLIPARRQNLELKRDLLEKSGQRLAAGEYE